MEVDLRLLRTLLDQTLPAEKAHLVDSWAAFGKRPRPKAPLFFLPMPFSGWVQTRTKDTSMGFEVDMGKDLPADDMEPQEAT